MQIDLNPHDIAFLIQCCEAYIRDYQSRGGSGYWRWRDRANEMIERLRQHQLELEMREARGKK